MPANFSNPAYVSTEGTTTKNPTNDGLPSYEEAIGVVKTPTVPAAQSTIEVVNEDASTRDDGGGDGSGSGGGRRHHRRRRHHHRHNQNSHNSEPNATDNEQTSRRHRHRRGFRKHLAKIKSRHQTETE